MVAKAKGLIPWSSPTALPSVSRERQQFGQGGAASDQRARSVREPGILSIYSAAGDAVVAAFSFSSVNLFLCPFVGLYCGLILSINPGHGRRR